jgi:hypothetical protein
MKKQEYVSLNQGIDIWEIDYMAGTVKLIEHPSWLDWAGLKVKSLKGSIGEYLTGKGYTVKENEDRSFHFK